MSRKSPAGEGAERVMNELLQTAEELARAGLMPLSELKALRALAAKPSKRPRRPRERSTGP